MAAFMQPPQYDLQCPAVAFTHAAAAPSNLDAAITIQSDLQRLSQTELQNTKK